MDMVDYHDSRITRETIQTGLMHGRISVDGHVMPYMKISANDQVTDKKEVWKLMSDGWKVPEPKLIISVTGIANNQPSGGNADASENFKKSLMKAAIDADAWIVTGGTDTGVMKMVGDANSEMGRQNDMVILGIAVWDMILNKESLINMENTGEFTADYFYKHNNFTNGTSSADQFSNSERRESLYPNGTNQTLPKKVRLNQNHTHFILVDSGKPEYRGEIAFRSELEEFVATQRKGIKVPIVLLVFNGGPGTLDTVDKAIKNETNIVVIEGSGRAADLIAYAAEDGHGNCCWFPKQQQAERRFERKDVERYLRVDKDEDMEKILAICRSCAGSRHLIHVIDLKSSNDQERLSEAIIKILQKDNEKYGKLIMKNLGAWKELVDEVDFVLRNLHSNDRSSYAFGRFEFENKHAESDLSSTDSLPELVDEVDFVLRNLHSNDRSSYAFGRFEFENKHTESDLSSTDSLPYITVAIDGREEFQLDKLADNVWTLMTEKWKVPKPKLIISVTGGAKSLNMNKKLSNNFKKSLIEAADASDAWIISGGTDTGIMKIVGDAAVKHQNRKMIVLGIAAWNRIRNKDGLEYTGENIFDNFRRKYNSNSQTDDGLTKPDLNHTHFIFVEDLRQSNVERKFGDEIEFRAKFEKKVSEVANAETGVPIVLLVLEGGANTLKTAAEAICNGTPVVVVAGSGRAADFIVHAMSARSSSEREEWEDRFKSRVQKILKRKNEEDVTGAELDNCSANLDKLLHPSRSHLLTIFHEKSIDSGRSISEAIFNSIFKTKKYEINELLRLTLAYNRIDEAKEQIFNYENVEGIKDSVATDCMLIALKENKHQFVKLLLDHRKITLKTFLTEEMLIKLYEIIHADTASRQKHKILRTAIQEESSHNRSKPNQVSPTWENSISLRQIGKVVHKLTNQFPKHYKTQKNLVKASRTYLPGTLPALMKNSKQDIFLWALLLNRIEMAMVFWEDGKESTAAALTANRILNGMANLAHQADEIDLYLDLIDNAKKFERHAVEVMNACYAKHTDKARQLLELDLSEHWGSKNLLTLANTAEQMDFMETTCCQIVLTEYWYREIIFSAKSYLKILQLSACLICPFLAPLVLQFKSKKDDDQLASLKEGPNKDGTRQKFQQFFRKSFTFLKTPMVKFCYYTISYLVFLALFSYFLMCDLYPITEQGPGICEILVWVWVGSFIIEIVKQIFRKNHLTEKWGSKWNYFEVFVTTFFVISFILRWTLHGSDFVWARMFYSASLAFYFIKFLRVFYVFERLGPLVIMTQYMLMDVLFFLLILIVFLLAFGITAQALLYPNAEPNWEVLKNVVYQPYFDIYGQMNLDELQGCVPGCSENATTVDDTACSEQSRCPQKSWLVMVSFAAYMMFINILLINLLIAMFGYTFNRVQSQSETVWRYHRYELIREYIDKPFLAPPFSIIANIITLFIVLPRARCQTKDNRKGETKLRRSLLAFEKARTDEYLYRLQNVKTDKQPTNSSANTIREEQEEDSRERWHI